MRQVKYRVPACKCINNLPNACKECINAVEPHIHSPATAYQVSNGTGHDRLLHPQPRVEAHQSKQILSVEEEKLIGRLCEALDDLDHIFKRKMVKASNMSLLPAGWQWQLAKYWFTWFLDQNISLMSMVGHHFDCHTAYATHPTIFKDFYCKAYKFQYLAIIFTNWGK